MSCDYYLSQFLLHGVSNAYLLRISKKTIYGLQDKSIIFTLLFGKPSA